jgi:hypothetical protein
MGDGGIDRVEGVFLKDGGLRWIFKRQSASNTVLFGRRKLRLRVACLPNVIGTDVGQLQHLLFTHAGENFSSCYL